MSNASLIILIAPNVSEQMGGEAIKALQIFREIRKAFPNTIQITHSRNRAELETRLHIPSVVFIEDTSTSRFLWKSIVFRWALGSWFSWAAIRRAELEISRLGIDPRLVVIHQTEPNSPVLPRTFSSRSRNVLGPVNGNIYYPRIFRDQEKLTPKLRRLLHMLVQKVLNRTILRGYSNVDQVLVAGGLRTIQSLLAAGCSSGVMMETVDCGIADKILDRPRIKQQGKNHVFVHYGRLVFHKGTHLIIQSLSLTRNRICIDIIGTGPQIEYCQALAKELGVNDRVRFLGWLPSHDELMDSLPQYRGVVLPSIEDANGIVIQEAMALGLPPICLDWGGPQLLVDHEANGILVKPESIEKILSGLASGMDRLCENPDIAERFSIAGRKKAESWRWSRVAQEWISSYPTETRPRG